MPQDQDTLEKELRRQMREGRAPLIQAVRDTYEPFLLAKKGWERKNTELREQVGLLSNQFSTKGRQLRESSRKSTDSGAGIGRSVQRPQQTGEGCINIDRQGTAEPHQAQQSVVDMSCRMSTVPGSLRAA